MKVKISSQERNPLLKRIEITFEVTHEEKQGTPSRFEIRKNLATDLNKDLELVYIKKMESKTGTNTTIGDANIYESKEQVMIIEPRYILARNEPTKEEGISE